ncbi:hypothetical protein AN220_28565, partial [Streptomyces nanshensis]
PGAATPPAEAEPGAADGAHVPEEQSEQPYAPAPTDTGGQDSGADLAVAEPDAGPEARYTDAAADVLGPDSFGAETDRAEPDAENAPPDTATPSWRAPSAAAPAPDTAPEPEE